jgi:hypothetical protein
MNSSLNVSRATVLLGLAWLGSGCGADGKPVEEQSANAGSGAAASSASTGGSAGRSGEAASSGGSAGASGSGGTSSGAGAGGSSPAPEVPRVITSDGSSILDGQFVLEASGPGVLCPGSGIYCNGSCLEKPGDSAGNCSIVVLGIQQAASVTLSDDSLYYTAGNREILRLDLGARMHTSLMRGLNDPDGLCVVGDMVYFGAQNNDHPPVTELYGVDTSGSVLRVLSQRFNAGKIRIVRSAGDRLVFGVGDVDYDLYTVARAGGQAEKLSSARVSNAVVGGSTIYYDQNGQIGAMQVDAPGAAAKLNNDPADSRMVLEGGYLYHVYQDVYSRVPVGGGATEPIQTFDTETRLLARTTSDVLLSRKDANQPGVAHLLRMPIGGGVPTELVSYEEQEYRDSVASATRLYMVVGQSREGALLRVSLD